MPRGSDWFFFIVVNLGFIIQIIIVQAQKTILNIQNNWVENRNNPLYLLFSSNPQQDFTTSIQNIQSSYMSYLLEPLNYITSNLSTMGGGYTDSLNDIRTVISNVRSFLSGIVEMVMGVFLNIMIEFQKVIMKMKDIVGKLIGIMVVALYMIQDCILTLQSAWNGLPGQSVRAVGSFTCFHPKTLVKTQSGRVYTIEELPVHEILEKGTPIVSVMKLNRGADNPFYELTGGVDGSPIWVTGHHLIWFQNRYRNVKDHPEARLREDVESDIVYCLITEDHHIELGTRRFHDWEDDDVRKTVF
jgi:hypothetical protein